MDFSPRVDLAKQLWCRCNVDKTQRGSSILLDFLYFSVRLRTSMYFFVLLGTSAYFYVLLRTSSHFRTFQVQKYALSPSVTYIGCVLFQCMRAFASVGFHHDKQARYMTHVGKNALDASYFNVGGRLPSWTFPHDQQAQYTPNVGKRTPTMSSHLPSWVFLPQQASRLHIQYG